MRTSRRVVVLDVPAAHLELASDALWQLAPSAVSESDAAPGRVRLTADVEWFENAFQLDGWVVQWLDVDSEEHLDAWRSWAAPVRAGRRVLIQPAWLTPAAGDDDVVVSIDPGRTFGSGSHPSTRQVIARLEVLVRGGESVLDVGCGSGVLGIVAVLLGAGGSTGVDIDPACCEVVESNARRNGVAGVTSVRAGTVDEVEGSFDLVLANIGLGVLVAEAAAIADRVAPKGTLVLAGLLDDQTDAAVAAYPDLLEVGRYSEEGWSVSVLRRHGTTATTSEIRTGR